MRRWCFRCRISADSAADRCTSCDERWAHVYNGEARSDTKPRPVRAVPIAESTVDLEAMWIPREVIALFSVELAHEHRAVPIHRLAKRVVVAMADPKDREAINRIREAIGLEVVVTAASDRAVSSALWKYYRRLHRE